MRQQIGMFEVHVVSSPEDFELGVKGEEGFEEILLVPEAVMAENPILGIFGGEKDVVAVDQDAWVEPGKDFEVLETDIAAGGENVA